MSPGISPMLHAVIALAEIDERTGNFPGGLARPNRTQLLPVSNYGDVRNVRNPGEQKPLPIPLDQIIRVSYTIPNSEAQSPFSRILERWVEPASRELAEMINDLSGNWRCFARQALPPDNLGIMSFRADHNDLSVMCTMAYSMKKQGIESELSVLCGWFDHHIK